MIPVVRPFARDGFLGPVGVFTSPQCRAILKHLERDERPAPAVWKKGGAVTDWMLSKIGAHPALLQLLTPILGPNIILWGCSLIRRKPGTIHPWHADIESSAPDGRFVTAWIGLENSSRSSLQLIAGSHLCGRTVQELRRENGCSRTDATTETVMRWARSANPDARMVDPDLSDGQAILFDGRMWHASENPGDGTRSALLLQFAAADCPVRIPDARVLDWPFQFLSTPRPPAVVVQGVTSTAENHLVPPARRPVVATLPRLASSSGNADGPPASRRAAGSLPRLTSSIRTLDMPLAQNPRGWQPYPLFRGSTPGIDSMSCHAAVLSAGHSPHPPHVHRDEELLIVLDGEADLLIADRPSYDAARAVRVKAGDFAYYPAGQHHTIRNPADSPVTYMMFRWNGRAAALVQDRLRTTVFREPPAAKADQARGFVTRRVLDAPTRWLRKLHCHTSRLESGAGYAPHVDPYDVAIYIQSGRVSTLGQEVGPGGVIYYSAGEVHGMRNIGDEPAQYITFEFHGAPRPGVQGRSSEGTDARLVAASPKRSTAAVFKE